LLLPLDINGQLLESIKEQASAIDSKLEDLRGALSSVSLDKLRVSIIDSLPTGDKWIGRVKLGDGTYFVHTGKYWAPYGHSYNVDKVLAVHTRLPTTQTVMWTTAGAKNPSGFLTATGRGVYIPSGVRGLIGRIYFYLKNDGTEDGSATVEVYRCRSDFDEGKDPILTLTFTQSAGTEGWVGVDVKKWWPWDSMYLRIASLDADISYGRDGTDTDYFRGADGNIIMSTDLRAIGDNRTYVGAGTYIPMFAIEVITGNIAETAIDDSVGYPDREPPPLGIVLLGYDGSYVRRVKTTSDGKLVLWLG